MTEFFENSFKLDIKILKGISIAKAIKTFKVNQLDSVSIKDMWLKIKYNNFDLIIDDGLHTIEASLNFFNNSFNQLRKGGLYIIEDINLENLNSIKNSLIKYSPEVVILKNDYYEKNPINNNNLILIRKI